MTAAEDAERKTISLYDALELKGRHPPRGLCPIGSETYRAEPFPSCSNGIVTNSVVLGMADQFLDCRRSEPDTQLSQFTIERRLVRMRSMESLCLVFTYMSLLTFWPGLTWSFAYACPGPHARLYAEHCECRVLDAGHR